MEITDVEVQVECPHFPSQLLCSLLEDLSLQHFLGAVLDVISLAQHFFSDLVPHANTALGSKNKLNVNSIK